VPVRLVDCRDHLLLEGDRDREPPEVEVPGEAEDPRERRVVEPGVIGIDAEVGEELRIELRAPAVEARVPGDPVETQGRVVPDGPNLFEERSRLVPGYA